MLHKNHDLSILTWSLLEVEGPYGRNTKQIVLSLIYLAYRRVGIF